MLKPALNCCWVILSTLYAVEEMNVQNTLDEVRTGCIRVKGTRNQSEGNEETKIKTTKLKNIGQIVTIKRGEFTSLRRSIPLHESVANVAINNPQQLGNQ